jgi:4-aminobutyrate aminotransferase
VTCCATTGAPKRSISRAEAVEAAFKLARHHTNRKYAIAFHGAFHGRTMGALSLTSSKSRQREKFAPLVPMTAHVAFGDLKAIESTLFRYQMNPSEVAAIFVEPIQGEGGYLVPPDGFLAGLRALCDRHGILLVFDEVQCGIGRTGRMFGWQHWGVRPDIITLAKGVGSGLPIGLCVAAKRLMEKWPAGSHANTFGGNPVCCAAALATLALVRDQYAENARQQGEYLMAKLRELAGESVCIGDVRGLGLMIGVEFVKERSAKTPAPELAKALVNRAYQNGLLLLTCGASSVRLIPPLMIDRKLVDEALAILRRSLGEALSSA